MNYSNNIQIKTITILSLFILSFISFIIGFSVNKKIIDMKRWPVLKNNGKITSSHIENKGYFDVVIKYEYNIKNKIYKNDKVNNRKIKWKTFADANKQLKKLRDIDKIAGGIDIIYNPLNPEDSYLEHNNLNNLYYYLSALLGIAGLIVYYIAKDNIYKNTDIIQNIGTLTRLPDNKKIINVTI